MKPKLRRFCYLNFILTNALITTFFTFFILAGAIAGKTASLDIQVTGKVVNAAGEGLQGVTVSLKGTAIGTATGAGGEYSISVPDNAVLVFSNVGYETEEVVVNGQSIINITLREITKSLEQVVVVGYGTQRKRDVTGSISSISGNEIAKEPVLTATQAIQGKVAGVQIISSGAPNSAPIVRIRGTGSILGGVNPLYVVDGVFTDDIRNINSADIVSMEILKDASSAAIYGVRGANGVILITTKRGKSGKMAVSYNAVAGMREASNLIKMANSSQYAKYINDAALTGPIIDTASIKSNTDWFSTILRRAFHQDHNISVSGASDKTNYFFSAGYYNEQGIVIDNKFERLTLRANNEYRISNKLKFNTLASYSNSNTQDVNLGSAYNNAYHAAPVIASKVNGKYGNTSAFQNVGNPLLDIESNNNKYKENRLLGTAALELKPVNWLIFRSGYNIELRFNNRKIYNYPFQNDSLTFDVTGGNQKNPKSALNITDDRFSRWVWDNTLTFQKSINKHSFTVLAGATTEKAFGESIIGGISDVPPDPDLWYLSQGDPSTQTNGSDAAKETRQSVLGRLNYNFNNKYLLTATFRADGSSRFLDHWGYFPSVGIGWNISKEGFMQRQDIINNLKLRASWGKLGNDNIDPNARYLTLTSGVPYAFLPIAYGYNILEQKDKFIKWETTEESDIGVEFSIFRSRLTGELDFYNKKAKDVLINVEFPAILASNSPVLTNVASIQNKGIEFSLGWNDKIGENITYSLSGNISHNQNKIIGLNGGQPIHAGQTGSKGNTTFTTNGETIASFYLLQANGVLHNQAEVDAYVDSHGMPIKVEGVVPVPGDLKYNDINDDGKIDDSDRVFSGAYQPKYNAGLNGSLTYKSIDLGFTLYGSYGGKVYNGKKEARVNSKDNIESSIAENHWTPLNYTSNEPRATLTALPHSTYFLESGSFTRINNLTIGYTFRKGSPGKSGINNFRIYITGENLATFTKYSGFTPELSSGDVLGQGIEFNAYPTTRSYVVGINLTF